MLKKLLACSLALAVLVTSLALSPILLQVAAQTPGGVLFSEDFNDPEHVNAYGSYHRQFTYVDSGDPAHQGAGKVEITNGETETEWWNWPTFLRLGAADGTSLVLQHNTTYQISYDLKCGASFATNAANRAIMKVVFGNNLDNISQGIDSSNSVYLNTVYARSDESFLHYTFNFSVPETITDETLAKGANFVVQGGWKNGSVDLMYDNIVVRDPSLDSGWITFDEEAQRKFYVDDGYSAQTNIATDDDSHGQVLRIYHINGNGDGGSASNQQVAYPARVAIYQDGNPMAAEAGVEYRIEYDIKVANMVADGEDKIRPIQMFVAFDTGKAYTENRNAKHTNGISIATKFSATTDWTHQIATFTAPSSVTGENIYLVMHHDLTSVWLGKSNDWDVRLDNIRLQKVHRCNVTLHPNNGTEETMQREVYEEQVPEKEVVPSLPGAQLVAWCADEALTQPIEVFEDGGEYWAKWNTAVVDGDTVENDGLLSYGTEFRKIEGQGVDGSDAFVINNHLTNWSWYPYFCVMNADGSYFRMAEGHQYTVTFDYKRTNTDVAFDAQAEIYLANGSSSTATKYSSGVSPTYFSVGENGFRHGTLKIQGTPNGYLYLVAAKFVSESIFDNIQVIDETAQVTVTLDGEAVAGYAGDPLTLPALDNEPAHDTVVGLADGHPAHMYKTEELTTATSQLAVVGSYAKDNDLVFRLRYRDLLYRADTSGVSVLGVKTADGETGVQEIGALAAATDTLGGKPLTVDNAEAKQTISVVGYDNQGGLDAELTLAAADAADYTVVAYVTTTEGETIYSVVRLGVATGRAAAETTAPDALSAGKEAYTPLDEVFGGWDADADSTVTQADFGALRKGLLESSLTGKQGKITNDDTADILDFVRGNYLNEHAVALSAAE